MLLTQYDEEKHMRDTYKEGYEEGEAAGYQKGEQIGYLQGEQVGEQNGYNKLLDAQIKKKLNRGKSVKEIAEELEIDSHTVEERLKYLKQ